MSFVRRVRRATLWGLVVLVLLLAGPVGVLLFGPVEIGGNWRTASRASAGLAPDPAVERQAVLQVYGARAHSWRGAFGIHTWIAAKPAGAGSYTRHEVVGWGVRYGGSAIRSRQTATPDGAWAGQPPQLLADLRGPAAAAAVARLDALVRAYPYPDRYRVWPGPNSNTFVATIARQLPELQVDFPPTAIGKDYLPGGALFAETPSGTGWQLSLFGLAGLTLAGDEGLEVNLLSLVAGLDLAQPALKLPGIGRVELSNQAVAGSQP